MPIGLPIEIYQDIFDVIAEDTGYLYVQKMRDLCACCLVCTSFVPLCQRHIFAQATIGDTTSQGSIGLPSNLQERPDLSIYLKHLVYLNGQDATKSTAPCMSALMNLPQLHRLDLLWCEDTSPAFGRDVSELEPFGPGQFFNHYISSGTLTTLSLDQIWFLPIYDVLSAANLTHLQIRNCGVIVEPDHLPASTNLRLLDIDHVDGLSLSNFVGIHTWLETLCIRWMLKGVTDSLTLPKVFPGLRKLRVHNYVHNNLTEKTMFLNRILETTGDLECLAVEGT
ncbi:hypothetical protein BJ165DRAFT_187722 [Panaeolus papilionaceus]|nr:hypothetical protein BJ165DRAFT_187722 [Panaeolus papilionaceus]